MGKAREVDAARNGQEALRMVGEADHKTLPYDLVLMDWKMPVMDGVAATLHIRPGDSPPWITLAVTDTVDEFMATTAPWQWHRPGRGAGVVDAVRC